MRGTSQQNFVQFYMENQRNRKLRLIKYRIIEHNVNVITAPIYWKRSRFKGLKCFMLKQTKIENIILSCFFFPNLFFCHLYLSCSSDTYRTVLLYRCIFNFEWIESTNHFA